MFTVFRVLLLDEATSALDMESEKIVQVTNQLNKLIIIIYINNNNLYKYEMVLKM